MACSIEVLIGFTTARCGSDPPAADGALQTAAVEGEAVAADIMTATLASDCTAVDVTSCIHRVTK